MKLLHVFRIQCLQQLRSPWDLILVLVFAPAFILAYWSFMGGGSTYYSLLVINRDHGSCPLGDAALSCAEQVVENLKDVSYASGNPLLKVSLLDDRDIAEKKLSDRDASALVIFPENFTEAIRRGVGQPLKDTAVHFVGDVNNPYYTVAAISAMVAVDEYLQEAFGQAYPVGMTEELLGESSTRTEFETYVPGLLITAVTLMMFSIAISLTHHIETGILKRLQVMRMTAFDLMCGISILYVIISIISLLLSFWLAQKLGFRSQGPLWVAIAICIITSISVIGVGLVTACFSKTSARAAILVNFPLVVLLFFTGTVFPPLKIKLFSIAGHVFYLFDFLPHSHAVIALNKVLSLGMGLGDVTFELAALVILSVLYFAIGVCLFNRMYLRPE